MGAVPLSAHRFAHNPRAAAFFDVDNTMMVGASIYHFARGLAARDYFSWFDLVSFMGRQARLRLVGENPQDIQRAKESALSFVAGRSVREIVELCEQIYDETMAERIWPGTRALAERHVQAEHRVWLVTATPLDLADIIGRRLGLTGALGTVAEVADGCYTGQLVGDLLHGQAKADAVLALAAREGLDLSVCSAYSDSINDVPLLSLVGHAVAVNPDSALRAEAVRRGWAIEDWRTGRKVAGRIGAALTVGRRRAS